MGRFLLVATLAVAVVFGGMALAATPEAGMFKSGEGSKGYDLQFKVRDGEIVDVVARAQHFCDGTLVPSPITVEPVATWAVDKAGRFAARKQHAEQDLLVYTTLTGHFMTKSVAKGTLRLEMVAGGSVCDTGEIRFVVKK